MMAHAVASVALVLTASLASVGVGPPDRAPRRPETVLLVVLEAPCPAVCVCLADADVTITTIVEDCLDIEIDDTAADLTHGCCPGAADCTESKCKTTGAKYRVMPLCGNATLIFGSSSQQVSNGAWSTWVGGETKSADCFAGLFDEELIRLLIWPGPLTVLQASAKYYCGGCPALAGR